MKKRCLDNICYLMKKGGFNNPVLRTVEIVYDYNDDFSCVRVTHILEDEVNYLNFTEEMLNELTVDEIGDKLFERRCNIIKEVKKCVDNVC